MNNKAVLVLEDGKIFSGKTLGIIGTTWGEVVFNTSMTGYEKILSDPSYKGQLVTLTYPLIGNYGLNEDDYESYDVHLEGLIIKESCQYPNHWDSNIDINTYFMEKKIIGITDIDTRALTRHIRNMGSMFGAISSEIFDTHELLEIVRQKVKEKVYLVNDVSISTPTRLKGNGPRIVVMDFGVKYNVIRFLKRFNADIFIVPANTSAQEVLNYYPDALLLSSGPGNPADIPEVVEEVKTLIGILPIFGICLGHQILGLALGATTYKLKFGHHGGNHPVKDLNSGKVIITTQNHGYAIKEDSLTDEIEVTHINLNDGTIEGMKHKKYPVLSIQYHPEAAPGPNDSNYIFYEFMKIIGDTKKFKISV